MVAKRKTVHKKHHTIITKMRKALDKIEDDIAHKVVHELKEHEKHSKKCVCKSCKTKKKKR